MSGSSDRTIQLWDAGNGVQINTFKGHSKEVHSVSFSPDDRCIVSGSEDMTVQLWDAGSGAQTHRFKRHSTCVESVSFSLDSQHILSKYQGNTCELWDARSGVHLYTPESHGSFAYYTAHAPNLQQPSFSKSWHIAPAQSYPIFGYIIDDDGWLFSVNPKQRLCWIPVSYRPQALASNGNCIGFSKHDGQLVILDLIGLDSYCDSF